MLNVFPSGASSLEIIEPLIEPPNEEDIVIAEECWEEFYEIFPGEVVPWELNDQELEIFKAKFTECSLSTAEVWCPFVMDFWGRYFSFLAIGRVIPAPVMLDSGLTLIAELLNYGYLLVIGGLPCSYAYSFPVIIPVIIDLIVYFWKNYMLNQVDVIETEGK
jgi:hypothetical protein